MCSQGFYPLTGACLPCHADCLNCTGASNTQCTSCVSYAILSGSTCLCPAGSYQSATPIQCSTCDPSCLNCTTSATTCTACDSTTNRVLSASLCVCNSPYADIGTINCGCDVGFTMTANVCNEICGDGILFTLPCDDGNTVSGDGCSADCNVEADFVCSNGNSSAPSQCSYTKPISIFLEETMKNNTANEVTFTFTVEPPLTSLTTLDFSTCVTTNLTGATLTFAYDPQGVLTVTVAYSQSIQNADVQLSFNPTVSGSILFLSTPNTVYNFTVQPDNNMAAIVYGDSVYQQS